MARNYSPLWTRLLVILLRIYGLVKYLAIKVFYQRPWFTLDSPFRSGSTRQIGQTLLD